MNGDVKTSNLSEVELLEKELDREKKKKKVLFEVSDTIKFIVVSLAVLILLKSYFFPVFRVSGDSMEPTLYEGNTLILLNTENIGIGDIVTFYHDGKFLVKRVIAEEGDIVNIKDDGTVYVNDKMLKERYVSEKSLGYCDIDLPLEVPENEYFVMGDNRGVSLDSRSQEIGCVPSDIVNGRLLFRIGSFEDVIRSVENKLFGGSPVK